MTDKLIALQTIQRLPLYLRMVREAIAAGNEFVSSAVIAKSLNLDPILTRKDLAVTGVTGTPRLGFPAVELRDAILACLGWDNNNEAVLCGVGHLGQALLGYGGFRDHSLSIVLACDTNPGLIGKKIHGVPVHDLAEMKKLVSRLKIKIGILTVPASAAQAAAEVLVEAGIKGIWNFTSVELHLNKDVIVQNEDLASSLALLSHAISRKAKK